MTWSYTIDYTVTDSALNIATPISRTVEVLKNTWGTDTTPPVVTLSWAISLTLEASRGSYLDASAFWSDNADGTGNTLSATFTQTGSVNMNLPWVYTITYTKVDTSSNTGSTSRTITIIDTTAPSVTLKGITPLTLTQGDAYTDSGAEWSDIVDGTGDTLTASFTLSGSVNTSQTGTYILTYTKETRVIIRDLLPELSLSSHPPSDQGVVDDLQDI